MSIRLCYLSCRTLRSHDNILYLLPNQEIQQNMNVISISHREQILALICTCGVHQAFPNRLSISSASAAPTPPRWNLESSVHPGKPRHRYPLRAAFHRVPRKRLASTPLHRAERSRLILREIGGVASSNASPEGRALI